MLQENVRLNAIYVYIYIYIYIYLRFKNFGMTKFSRFGFESGEGKFSLPYVRGCTFAVFLKFRGFIATAKISASQKKSEYTVLNV